MKKIYFSSLAVILFGVVNAQYAGLSSSSWAGISTISLNPAIADNKYVFDIGLGAVNTSVNNNMLGISASSLLFDPFGHKQNTSDFFTDSLFDKNPTNQRNPKKGFNSSSRTQVQGPLSFLFGFGYKNENAIAFTYDFNMLKSTHLGDPSIYNLANDFLSNPPVASGTQASPVTKTLNLAMTSLSWADIGATYSRVLFDNNIHFFKAGVTLKYIQGVSAQELNTTNTTLSIYEAYNTVKFDNANFSYAHTTDAYAFHTPLAINFEASPTVGADIGFEYEWRPDIAKYRYEMDGLKNIRPRDVDLHKIAIGFAISDIGAINYKNNAAAQDFTLNGYYTANTELTNSFNFRQNGNAQLDNFINNTNYAQKTSDSTKTNFKIWLPMRLTGTVDWNVAKGFGVNLRAIIYPDVTPKSLMFAHDVTTVTVTARYDKSWFGVYLPLSYDAYNNFNVGLGARFGPVSVGFQNLLAWFAPKGIFNGSFYASVHIPLPNRKPKDSDGDLVSDKKDLCPHEPGKWATKGCPDADSDGVYDAIDSCPHDPGPDKYHGCPDRDGDGIIDKNDSCPDEAGPPELFGCPDRDRDGIADRLDECPDQYGPATANGCPDRDGDGVPDYRDDCPNDKGPAELKGCPDSDNDGTPDKDDKCPTLKGPKEHHGCPDSDGDGVFDDEDKCPTVPGTIANHGCPDESDVDTTTDSDNDGVPDFRDDCPYEKGLAIFKGCPQPKHLTAQSDDAIYGEVNFDEEQSTLTTMGKLLLDQFIKAKLEDMNNTSGYKWILMLKGYADKDEGATAKEKETLSKKRLIAVYDYLIKNGVPRDLIQSDFVGDAESLAPSDSEVHKKQNRVVELTQRFMK